MGVRLGEARGSLGDYLAESEPVSTLWPDMVDAVYRDSPRQAHPERLSPAARTLFYVGCFESELINGGMSQFFSNSAGNRTYATLAALEKIGAAVSADLLRRATAAFPGGAVPADRQQRCDLLFAFEERDPQFLQRLSQEYYSRVDTPDGVPEENLTLKQSVFMRANATAPVSAA